MRGLLFIAAHVFALVRSYTPSTCSECVATEGMTWKVLHKGSTIDVRCVPTEECQEGTSKEETVMCYPLECGKMPDKDGEKWWYEGTRHDDRCNTDSTPFECMQSGQCAWVRSSDGEHCIFLIFGLQLSKTIDFICPRPWDKPEVLPIIEKMGAEEPAIEKMTAGTCGECVAKSGYSWKVELQATRGMPAKYMTSCVPTEECKEYTTMYQTALCFSLHCDSLKSTKEISDWWTAQVTEYKQCSSFRELQDCTWDNECAYIEEDIHTGYCLFKQFADYFGKTDHCGYL